jgi:hypothetical protein
VADPLGHKLDVIASSDKRAVAKLWRAS